MAVRAQDMMERAPARGFAANRDVILAAAIVGILVVMVIPIPPSLLDLLLVMSITLSIIIFLVTMYLREPVEFSVFPALLLVITLYRLSLNVASTRLILSEAQAGTVIQAFGQYVVSGNYVVGLVVFAILIIIQFVVITKGAGRISEVAARFTLDAMPGKQMAIDADLNSGLIDEDQARARRLSIEREADFYGAMDGATKFVRGDAIAGLLITTVNIIGGFAIGVLQRGMSVADAAQTYTLLTVGDGLVTQIPALVTATSAGLIVTRTVSESDLGTDIATQTFSNPRPVLIAAGVLFFFGAVGGLPPVPFILMSLVVGLIGFQTHRAQTAAVTEARRRKEEERVAAAPTEERTEDLLQIDPMEIDIGYGLIPMADPAQQADLLTRIGKIRSSLALQLGIIVPRIRIRDNMQLNPNEYVIKIREQEVARYELMMDHLLAMNPGIVKEPISGIPTKEPAFGLEAFWITEPNRTVAEEMGYTVVDPGSVLATHLTEVIKAHAAELTGRQEVHVLVENLKKTSLVLVEDLIPGKLALGEVQKVFQNLLKERVSIRNLTQILETLSEYAPRTRDTDLLTEYARHSLGRTICAEFMDDQKRMFVVTLDPALEKEISDGVTESAGITYLVLDPTRSKEISQRISDGIQPLITAGHHPMLLCSANVRRHIRRLVERAMPMLAVLSYNEIDPLVKLQSVGMVSQ